MIYDIIQARAIRKNLLRIVVEVYNDDEDLQGVYEIAITAHKEDTLDQIGERIKFAIDGMEDTWEIADRVHGQSIVVSNEPVASVMPGYDKAEGK